ncbi:hypothetical protein GBAR_LOCUS10200 [Geodia barretti]|uniref:Uncharacterized protein n=1 Tax=Geodia barretti TaxID=519541 RepID=A0AA35RSU0_GEOBA|nr:hypothetical protein GBAR_LOCUS10200 [Geodia barretti]
METANGKASDSEVCPSGNSPISTGSIALLALGVQAFAFLFRVCTRCYKQARSGQWLLAGG